MRRAGVTAKAIMMKRIAHMPKRSWMSSIGLALRLPVISKASLATSNAGSRQTRKTIGFQTNRICCSVFTGG